MLYKDSFVMNKTTGETFQITTDSKQTRNRRQCKSTAIRNPYVTQIAESKLVPLTAFEAAIAVAGEKIIRGKMAMSEYESAVVAMYRLLKKNVMA